MVSQTVGDDVISLADGWTRLLGTEVIGGGLFTAARIPAPRAFEHVGWIIEENAWERIRPRPGTPLTEGVGPTPDPSPITMQALLANLETRQRQRIRPPLQRWGLTIPRVLASFVDALERSRAMLALEDNWDDEGSPGYTEATWRRAAGIAIRSAETFVAAHDHAVPTPALSKGPDGSVDILWKAGTKKVMINVPAESDESMTYHGFDRESGNRETKGTLDPADRNDWVLRWLTQ